MSEYQSLQPPDMNTQERSVSQRLRYLTPLSVVVSLGANAIAMAATPSLADISDQNPTYMTPESKYIGVYWLVLYSLQFYHSFVVWTSLKQSAQSPRHADLTATLLDIISYKLVFANFGMAAWALLWMLRLFALSQIVLIVNFFFLASAYLGLTMRAPASTQVGKSFWSIHTPIRLYMAITIIDLFHNGFIAFMPAPPSSFSAVTATVSTLFIAALSALFTLLRNDSTTGIALAYGILALASHARSEPEAIDVQKTWGRILFGLLFWIAVLYRGWKVWRQRQQRAVELGDGTEERFESV